MAIKGMVNVRRNINRTLTGVIPNKAEKAVHVATAIIAGYATLLTPIDTSVLANSQYRVVQTERGRVLGAIGYTARYAGYVHGASGKLKGKQRSNGNGTYWSPDAEPEFLTKAGDDNVAEIDAAVARVMKI